MRYLIGLATLPVILSLMVFFSQKSLLELCEIEKCPLCFGDNLCKDFKLNKINKQYKTFSDFIFNILSVKNVFFGDYEGKKVVLKKLGYSSDLKQIDEVENILNYIESIFRNLNSGELLKDFKTCDDFTSDYFLREVTKNNTGEKLYKEIWSMLQVNVEPLLLQIFSYKSFPVPKLYGFCGRMMIVENCGWTLNYFENSVWSLRAFLALQLLQAAKNFTENHDIFRLYLTDISPDNVAVSEGYEICFVDLENAILALKRNVSSIHYSKHFEEGYMFSHKEICGSTISDHNIYSVCRLLLSENAPWPMMKNGLLHSPPQIILEERRDLFKKIELCVVSGTEINRFILANEIIEILLEILTQDLLSHQ